VLKKEGVTANTWDRGTGERVGERVRT